MLLRADLFSSAAEYQRRARIIDMRSSAKVLSVAMLALNLSAQTLNPPVAPIARHMEVRHGATVNDNYFWLREKSNPKVRQYLEAENAYTEAMTKNLQPFSDALYKEMLSHIKQTDLTVPVRRGSNFYYSRTEEGKQYPIQCRRKGSMEAPEEILLDPNELAKTQKFVGVGAFVVSDDQNMLAYTTDYTGFRQFSLRVKDLRTGETLPDTTERVTSVAWAADNKTLFLTTEDARHQALEQGSGVTRSAPPASILYMKRRMNSTTSVSPKRATSNTSFLAIESTDTTEYRYVRADHPADGFAVLLPREKKHRYYPDHREGMFYIRSNKGAKNFQIVTAPAADPAPEELEGLHPPSGGRAHRGYRSVPRFCSGRRAIAGCQHPPHSRLPKGFVDAHRVSGADLLRDPRCHARLRLEDLSLQLPEFCYAAKRLRLRYRGLASRSF